MNIMEVEGYKVKIEYDPELDQFRGEIAARASAESKSINRLVAEILKHSVRE